MNFYTVQGQATQFLSGCFSKLGFKNIKSIEKKHNNFTLHMKNGDKSEVRFIPPEEGVIIWGVEDFKYKAKELKGDKWDTYYNPFLFYKALDDMIYHHDANIGITWDTIEYYLNEQCKR